ncbi:hypothetical protein EOA13_33020 [Mesorhizobium sp. M7A.F.Ca.US.011.01.1.1]|uniref:hypothetical protein n=1 Tax=Mesorhizobium sp. M7A.F.Ca.US.011.01.1.1 TaxID=2496741 RepID=UPI000FCC65DF|nr:hypothetical protein [Mesorhizobium sp. M7A.F.Ca.US.011.01.1.1]RUX23778.1 hypothetical protein EOA13_33020 [Mesorhizobium sp. M7A.F.Ca.US.011.01.1.1]
MNAHMLGDATKEKTTFRDLETLICDADNMLDVLADMLENCFAKAPPEGSNYVVTDPEGTRLLFVAYEAVKMSMKVRKTYFEALEGAAS